MPTNLPWPLGAESKLSIDPDYGQHDADTLMLFSRWDAPAGCTVMEVGANEERSAQILADNDHRVLGIDLRPHAEHGVLGYTRMEGDFVKLAGFLKGYWDCIYSTSAIEHFGLGVYGDQDRDPLKDMKAMTWMHRLLRPGGLCYITVPYGREHVDAQDWRVYDAKSLEWRIVQEFNVIDKAFFKSGGCICPDVDNMVTREDADEYDGSMQPHVTVWLKMEKR